MRKPILKNVLKKTVFVLLSVFLACDSFNTDTKAVRLSSWVSSPTETRLLEETLAAFHQQHPQIQFSHEPIPGNYSEKIQLMLGTYTAPDLFYLKGEFAPSYMRYNILMPLNKYADATPDFELDDFYPSLLEAFQKDSVYYGFPKDFNPYILFYNRAMFQEAGLENPPDNWTELSEWSETLTRDTNGDGDPDQFGLVIQASLDMLMPFVFQNDGEFQRSDGELGITDPAFVEALEFYHGLYKRGIATTPNKIGTDWNGDAFGRGKCAMIIAGGWVIPFLEETYPEIDYGVAVLPAGKKRGTVAFTTAYVMPKYSARADEAWQLMSYLTGREGMASWTRLGLALPARRSVAVANGFYDDPVFKYFMESAEFARVFQVNYQERWYDEGQTAMQKVFFLDVPPAEAMAELKQRLEKFKL